MTCDIRYRCLGCLGCPRSASQDFFLDHDHDHDDTMRGEAALPEELLRNILSYNLIIDPDTFLAFPRTGYPRWQAGQKDTGSRKHQAPAFHVLSVSKRWLRVGTPLLYECVTVATLEHTRRLADFLQKHPEVGKAIRHLRLEGGMGRELFQVARWVVGLQTLYVSLHVRASESVAGLAKALPVLKPRVLRLHGTGYNLPNVRQNNAYHEIYAALAMNIRFWPSLVRTPIPPDTVILTQATGVRDALPQLHHDVEDGRRIAQCTCAERDSDRGMGRYEGMGAQRARSDHRGQHDARAHILRLREGLG